ncbi:MAG TPA: DNA polymerase III subunit [Erysipelotrichaceae bacterium]|nr:DNA polymerase III subunit [Erysipelotrichaceae bacterium]
MKVESFLENYQPVVYKTFLNSLQLGRLSHAYLIVGDNGAPLLEVAKFFSKSIMCDKPSPLACNSCITCLRMDDDNYPDFIFFDGSKATIKKEEVIKIETSFDKEAFENKGIRIYILHLIENMTVQAINSILKLLEEPGKQIYAFLTTNNENSVLPTILSRCQILRLKQVDKTIVIEDAINNGVEKKDAELLSYFYNDGDLVKQILDNPEENEAFMMAKTCFEQTMEAIYEGTKDDVINFGQSIVSPRIKSKESCRYYINMLVMAYEDILAIKNGKPPFLQSYATMLEHLVDKLNHHDESLIELLKCSTALNLNVNIALLIDHIFYTITKEE